MSEVPWPVLRAKIAGLSRDRSPDDPELVAARQNLAATKLREIVRRKLEVVALTVEQQDSIVAILRGAR